MNVKMNFECGHNRSRLGYLSNKIIIEQTTENRNSSKNKANLTNQIGGLCGTFEKNDKNCSNFIFPNQTCETDPYKLISYWKYAFKSHFKII